jgi:hypothetical protein
MANSIWRIRTANARDIFGACEIKLIQYRGVDRNIEFPGKQLAAAQ